MNVMLEVNGRKNDSYYFKYSTKFPQLPFLRRYVFDARQGWCILQAGLENNLEASVRHAACNSFDRVTIFALRYLDFRYAD